MATELKLIKQIQRKANQSAANSLISKYYHEIYAYMYKQTMNKELALDLTQDIFIHVLQAIHSFDEKKASFRTWLYRLATNKIVDYFRSRHYKVNHFLAPIEDDDVILPDDFTIHLEYKEDIAKITAIVNQLEVHTQQIFRLKFFAEYTFLEISAALEIPESTVKTKYYSMIRKIKKQFEEINDG